MFILGEDTATQAEELVQFEERGMIGEAEELSVMSIDLVEGYASLSMAFARLEAKAIREHATDGVLSEDTQTLLEEASKSFFKRAVEFIREYWNKFIDHIKKAFNKVKNFLTTQKKLVNDNRAKLNDLTDENLKSIKFDRTKVVADPSILTKIVDGASKAAAEGVQKANGTAEDFKKFNYELVAVRSMGINGMPKDKSISAVVKDAVTGVKDKDAVMTKSDIDNAIKIFDEATKTEGTVKIAEQQASNAIKLAEQQAKVASSDKDGAKQKEAKDVVSNLRSVSSKIGNTFSAVTSAAASAASNAGSVLRRGVSVTLKEESTPVTENTDPLERYLV